MFITFFKSLGRLKNLLWSFFNWIIIKPIFFLGVYLIKPIVLLIYKIYLFIKRNLAKIYQPAKNKFFYPLLSRSAIHVIVIIFIFSVTANNLQASNINSDFGQKSILYSLVSDEEEQLTEETANLTVENKFSNLGPSVGVVSVPILTEKGAEGDEETNENTSITMSTQGSSALVKPNITSSLADNTNRLRETIEEYIVQEGDSIGSIAQDFGISVNTILWENNLGSKDYIKPGQKLIILPTSGLSHTVKKGDTLEKLAKTYGVDQKDILAFNEILDPSEIKVGQKLIIPEGTPPTLAAPSNRTKLAKIKDLFIPPPAKNTTTRLLWPTPGHVITQYFSWRHTGLDIDGNYSSPLYAAEDGVVEYAGWNKGGYGLMILINHGNGLKTRYGHASKIFVQVGQHVKRGQTIAMMGTTGRSTGTHLHFEVILNGVRKNPLAYIR